MSPPLVTDSAPKSAVQFVAAFLVRCFVALGAVFIRIYSPQCRINRRTYAKEMLLWAGTGALTARLLIWAADSPLIADETIVAIANVLPWAVTFWSVALLSVTARRLHDIGIRGGWALFVQVPFVGPVLLAALFVAAGRDAGRAWPSVEEAAAGLRQDPRAVQ